MEYFLLSYLCAWQAVKNKMALEGLDGAILDNPEAPRYSTSIVYSIQINLQYL